MAPWFRGCRSRYKIEPRKFSVLSNFVDHCSNLRNSFNFVLRGLVHPHCDYMKNWFYWIINICRCGVYNWLIIILLFTCRSSTIWNTLKSESKYIKHMILWKSWMRRNIIWGCYFNTMKEAKVNLYYRMIVSHNFLFYLNYRVVLLSSYSSIIYITNNIFP